MRCDYNPTRTHLQLSLFFMIGEKIYIYICVLFTKCGSFQAPPVSIHENALKSSEAAALLKRNSGFETMEKSRMVVSIDWFCWDKLQENPIFHGKIYGFRL